MIPGAGQKNQGAAESVRREDEMTMAMPFGLQIGFPSAWADGFRRSLEDVRSTGGKEGRYPIAHAHAASW